MAKVEAVGQSDEIRQDLDVKQGQPGSGKRSKETWRDQARSRQKRREKVSCVHRKNIHPYHVSGERVGSTEGEDRSRSGSMQRWLIAPIWIRGPVTKAKAVGWRQAHTQGAEALWRDRGDIGRSGEVGKIKRDQGIRAAVEGDMWRDQARSRQIWQGLERLERSDELPFHK